MKICETFRSLQGEGIKIGKLTYFIRTVGCNLQCSWCDTQYAMEGGNDMSVDELMELVEDDTDVCLTGGEPMLQKDVIELLTRLSDAGKDTVLETNGAVDLSNVPDRQNIIISMDIKCPSSGMQDRNLFSNIELLKKKDQLKFVIADGADLEYAIQTLGDYHPKCEVIFSPVGGMDVEPLAEEVIARRLNVRVLIQLHKLIWGNKKGV
jgi:7-carboxy-7-deazaguanine synthase